MIEIDDSMLTADRKDFLERWAKVLDVSVPELLGRILIAGIEGEVYCEKCPPEVAAWAKPRWPPENRP